jgi:hypothetical protein
MTIFLILLGPVSGWILASFGGKLLSALGILVPVTLACAIPLAVYWYRRRAVWLAIALLLWVAAGYLFTVAIWV